MTFELAGTLSELKDDFEARFCSFRDRQYNHDNPLLPVMHYVLSGSGKRVRALFCLLSTRAFDIEVRRAYIPAIALEMLHAYSLVHDDLPCMDDDPLRRGRPTAHVRYGEASALLAGDAIHSDCIALLAGCYDEVHFAVNDLSAEQRLLLISELMTAAGSSGMALGQALDLHWTQKKMQQQEVLDEIHLKKTGTLMGAACAMGAIVGGATPNQITVFRSFGQKIGLAFQIIDDLVDLNDNTGKSAGKDREAGKLTYLSIMTQEQAQTSAATLTHAAVTELEALALNTGELVAFSRQLLEREY